MNPMVIGTLISAVLLNMAIILTRFFGWYALLLNAFVVYSLYNNLRRK